MTIYCYNIVTKMFVNLCEWFSLQLMYALNKRCMWLSDDSRMAANDNFYSALEFLGFVSLYVLKTMCTLESFCCRQTRF